MIAVLQNLYINLVQVFFDDICCCPTGVPATLYSSFTGCGIRNFEPSVVSALLILIGGD